METLKAFILTKWQLAVLAVLALTVGLGAWFYAQKQPGTEGMPVVQVEKEVRSQTEDIQMVEKLEKELQNIEIPDLDKDLQEIETLGQQL